MPCTAAVAVMPWCRDAFSSVQGLRRVPGEWAGRAEWGAQGGRWRAGVVRRSASSNFGAKLFVSRRKRNFAARPAAAARMKSEAPTTRRHDKDADGWMKSRTKTRMEDKQGGRRTTAGDERRGQHVAANRERAVCMEVQRRGGARCHLQCRCRWFIHLMYRVRPQSRVTMRTSSLHVSAGKPLSAPSPAGSCVSACGWRCRWRRR